MDQSGPTLTQKRFNCIVDQAIKDPMYPWLVHKNFRVLDRLWAFLGWPRPGVGPTASVKTIWVALPCSIISEVGTVNVQHADWHRRTERIFGHHRQRLSRHEMETSKRNLLKNCRYNQAKLTESPAGQNNSLAPTKLCTSLLKAAPSDSLKPFTRRGKQKTDLCYNFPLL